MTTPSTQPDLLTPDSLHHHLRSASPDLDTLLEKFDATLDDLEAILDSPELTQRQRLQARLAHIHCQNLALQALPDCTLKLLALTACEKPEVARRSINSLMNLSGLATAPVKPPPTPVPSASPQTTADAPQPPLRKPTDEEIDEALMCTGRLLELRRQHGINLGQLLDDDFPHFVDLVVNYFQQADVHFGGRYHCGPAPTNLNDPVARARIIAVLKGHSQASLLDPPYTAQLNQTPIKSTPSASP